ncbi:MAG: hypothetical protein SWX82_03160 [Cyanobacteriota bacterium]|nr:hypothetical protein [Cyanobacteriota bacterium]
MTNQTNTGPNYDANITPTDVADRMEREGENFMKTPETEAEENNTASGYTVDTEGRLNNFAVEPEMYVNEPGDLRQQEEEQGVERAKTMKEVNQTNEEGNLSMSEDNRGKGTGKI